MRPITLLLSALFAAVLLSPAAALADAPAAAGSARSEVVMYVLPDCGYCERARQFLTQHNIVWREVDIEASTDAHAEFTARGGVGTPLIVIGDDRVQGYDPARLQAALVKHRLLTAP